MKGIIFQLAESIVTQHHGAAVWDQLLTDTGLDGVYTSLGSYPDEHLGLLVGAASARLGLPANDIVRWLGREAMPHLAGHYPQVFAPHTRARDFVLTLNSIIHPQVRKMYPGASVPDFDFDASDPDVLVMLYRSERKMCAFGEGLLLGAADHYREELLIEHPSCMHRGDPHCELRLRFRPRPA